MNAERTQQFNHQDHSATTKEETLLKIIIEDNGTTDVLDNIKQFVLVADNGERNVININCDEIFLGFVATRIQYSFFKHITDIEVPILDKGAIS